jgi:hypothetical protein
MPAVGGCEHRISAGQVPDLARRDVIVPDRCDILADVGPVKAAAGLDHGIGCWGIDCCQDMLGPGGQVADVQLTAVIDPGNQH